MFCVKFYLSHQSDSVQILTTLPFDKIPHFSQRDIAYQTADERLRPYYQHDVSIEALADAIAAKQQSKLYREVLVQGLKEQYQGVETTDAVRANIEALRDDHTFTIVTAHQPSILTGPLYYIHKICSTISLTRQLNARYTDHRFVPVFVSGGEDHDFDEIATLHLFGKDFTWETDQVGAVGRMSLDGLSDVLTAVKETFGTSPHAEELAHMIDQAFAKAKHYGDFMFRLTDALFSQHGLVVVNMDNNAYKEVFLPYVIQDIEKEISASAVRKDQEKLEAAGFSGQAHAREVNIFVHDGDRHRVIKTDDGYTINDKTYSQEELIAYLKAKPESISPNVVLRPIFQELILPNLAYIGGGGELAYWMERVSLFEEMELPFPMLIRRDSALLVDKRSHDYITEQGLSIEQMFDREEQVVIKFTLEDSDKALSLKTYKEEVAAIFAKMDQYVIEIDPTLSGSVNAEKAKAEKAIDNLENKMIKAEKRAKETQINKLTKIKNKLFPNGDSLQERYDNFIPFFLRYGSEWIDQLTELLDPMNKEFKIILLD